MMTTLLLKGGKAFVGNCLKETDILISEGKIRRIGKHIRACDDISVIDCSGKIILPGIIDPHVHFREPGLTHKEDFLTGSMAAAAGGITTILDMPNTKPATLTLKDLEEKRKLASEKSLVNFGFHFGSSVDNLAEIDKAENVASTKLFMNWSTGNMKIDDEKKLEEIFLASKIVSVHAEGDEVKHAVTLSQKTNTKLYLCHISAKDEIDYLKKNKVDNIFIEVTPHHLYLTARKDDSLFSVKPSLKRHVDNLSLWVEVNRGFVDTIGSDHAPHTLEEKDSVNPPSGMPGEETLLPLLLDAVNRGKLTIKRLVEMCCYNPASIFGIGGKGQLRKGFDADIVVIDMNLKKKVDNKKLLTKCKWSAFNGKVLKGWPVTTIVNGNVVFSNGKIDSTAKGKEVRFIR